jgi:hypothetical protein
MTIGPTTHHLVPDGDLREFRVSQSNRCPICDHGDWCLSDGATWAICQRQESPERWKDAGWLHRIGAPRQGGGGNGQRRPASATSPKPKPDPAAHWLWRTSEQAAAAFAALPLARDDAAVRDFMARDYGLAVDTIPSDWRALDHPSHGVGVVYPGRTADGAPTYKFRSIQRNEKGKRRAAFLHGGDGVIALSASDPDAPLVIVAGEEKAAAACAASFNVIGQLAGEKQLTDAFVALIADPAARPGKIIIANDADGDGAKANEATARALEAAGVPASSIFIAQWPEDAPEGHDLNDVLKTGGVDGLRNFLNAARPFQPTTNRALSLAEFMDTPREPLRYHIKGVLPERGKLTLSAIAKGFKTTLEIELGMCVAAGNVEFLGFEFGDPASVLFVQPELSDGLLAERMHWILNTAPAWLDVTRARQNFHVLETIHGRPALWHEHPRAIQSRSELERGIERNAIRVVLVDSLYMTFCGMDENAASQMSLALDYLASLTVSYGSAIILVHHFGKAATGSRGSSVFQGWGESDLAIHPVENEPVVKVEALLRCSFPKGYPAYWRRPDETTAWFSTMPQGWEPTTRKGGRPTSYPPSLAAVVLQARGGLRWGDLRAAIIEVSGCSERKAESLITQARQSDLIHQQSGLFSVARGGAQ